MSIYKIIDSITRYLSEGVARLFSPSDDAYPIIGVQPFTGEPFNPEHNAD